MRVWMSDSVRREDDVCTLCTLCTDGVPMSCGPPESGSAFASAEAAAAAAAAAEQDVVDEGVVARARRVAGEEVVEVTRRRDAVARVGRRRLDRVHQRLVEEELRQVRHHAPRVRAVLQHARAHVRDDVLVRRSPFVVAPGTRRDRSAQFLFPEALPG